MLPGPLFAGLPPATLVMLEETGSQRIIEIGRNLFNEGDAAASLIVILDGQVRVWRSSPNGALMTVHEFGPGDIPGCVAVFQQIPYPATATATSQVKVMSWPAHRVPALLQENPALAANALTIVGQRNKEMLERLLEVSTQGVEQRLARTMLRLIAVRDAHGNTSPEVRISRQQLAELTATTLHTVSRFISRWEGAAIVSGGRGRILVRDRAALTCIAEQPRDQ